MNAFNSLKTVVLYFSADYLLATMQIRLQKCTAQRCSTCKDIMLVGFTILTKSQGDSKVYGLKKQSFIVC